MEYLGLSVACISQGQTEGQKYCLLCVCAPGRRQLFIPSKSQKEADKFGLNGPSASYRC